MNPSPTMEEAFRQIADGVGHHIKVEVDILSIEYRRPSFMLKPRLSIDGNQWCALYGDNLQDGVAGFGDSPALAFEDFDKNFAAKVPQVPTPSCPLNNPKCRGSVCYRFDECEVRS